MLIIGIMVGCHTLDGRKAPASAGGRDSCLDNSLSAFIISYLLVELE